MWEEVVPYLKKHKIQFIFIKPGAIYIFIIFIFKNMYTFCFNNTFGKFNISDWFQLK